MDKPFQELKTKNMCKSCNQPMRELVPEMEALFDGYPRQGVVSRQSSRVLTIPRKKKTVNTKPIFLVKSKAVYGLTNDESQQPELGPCTPPIVLDRFDLGEYKIRYHHYQQLLDAHDLIDAAAQMSWPQGTTPVLMIFGHTDKSGNETGNSGLSMGRAFEVVHWLKESFFGQLPIDYVTIGLGATKPVSSTDAAKNRRVEIVVCTIVQPPQPLPVAGQPRGRNRNAG
jgi:outer membrane protein OmpA-like peptidoglycan-associated protein